MWFKTIAVIFFGVIAIAFLSDLYVIDTVYQKAGRGIEHSIDAGIIKSVSVKDAQEGNIRLNGVELKNAVRTEFQRNMKLDNHLENNVMKDSQFDLRMEYVDELPWIEVIFKTNVSFSIPDIDYPITIKRKIPYESIYK